MFPLWQSLPRSGARALTRLLLALAFALALRQSAEAAGTFVPAPSRVDMVYDSARDTLYVTSGASVLRYQLGTNSFLPPFNLGGSLGGLDLSPDGNTLVVADRTRTEANVWVHVIDLASGESRRVNFPRDFMEGGTFTVAYGADSRVLITSTFEGSGWVPLRKLDPATGEWSRLDHLLQDSLGDIRQDTMLAASGDRSVVGFAEANISDGRWGSYNVAAGTLAHRIGYDNGTSGSNFEIGVNRNGTQYAIPTYKGTFFYNANFAKTGTVGTYAGPTPVGVVYHPVEDIVYFPWTTTTEVRAFNTNTLAQVAAYDFQDNFAWNGGWAFRQGRMKMSRDGSLLFATVTGGVRFVRLYAPLAAEAQSVETAEETPVEVTLAGSVGNGGALSFRVVTQPAHGTLSGSGASLVYTPEAGYEGADGFTFVSVYGPAESAPAAVSVNVVGVNDAPTADELSVAVDEDASAAVTLAGTDPEGSALTFAVVDGPSYGTLSGEAPNLVYTPAANYYGSDSFTFSVGDGAASSVGHVYVTVNGVNDAPSAEGQSLTTNEDQSVSVTLAGADIDSGPPSFVVTAQPAHGTLSGTVPNLVYTPNPNYNGPDGFGFKATDGAADSSVAAVQLNVAAVNDAPTANSQTVATSEDTAQAVKLSGSDVDGDPLTYLLVNPPTRGSVTGTVPNLVYTPAANSNGPDSFTFMVSDGKSQSATATVNVNVAAVNDAPVAVADSVTTTRNTAVNVAVLSNDGDVDGDPLTVTSTAAVNGTVTVAPDGKSVYYTPRKNYRGSDSFTYTVGDGRGGTATASVTVAVR